MKYLIIGLGNPGLEYKLTRHNVGFRVADFFAKKSENSFVTDRYADVLELKFKGRKIIVIKPNTFMNLSGKAVNYWMQKLKIQTDNILVITDDISLPLGNLRMKRKGSDGGHNGLKDINNILGTSDYPRLRFGIGSNFQKGKQADYVLSEFTEKENLFLEEKVELALKMIQGFTTVGIEETMQKFNRK